MSNERELLSTILKGNSLLSHLDLSTVKSLAGGVVSIILAAEIKEGQVEEAAQDFTSTPDAPNLVIKHTYLPQDIKLGSIFGHTDQISLHEKAHLTQDLDHKILLLLQDHEVNTPQLLAYDRDRRATIMTDFNHQGYTLMQELMINDSLPLDSASNWGQMLAILTQKLKEETGNLQQVEDSVIQVRERLEELYNFLRADLNLYREIEQQFLSGEYLIDADVHPKNIALDDQGTPMVFDFGRCVRADIQHVPATFSAHVALAVIGGCFKEISFGIDYLKEFLRAYDEQSPEEDRVKEGWYVRYFTAELLHRGLSGRWLDPNLFSNSSLQEVERAVHDIAIAVFRPDGDQGQIETVDQLFSLIQGVAEKIRQGSYKGMR